MTGRDKSAGKRRVLLIYRALTPSVRLCGHCQMEYLATRGKLEYRAVQELKLRVRDIKWADIVLLGRLDSWYEYQLTQMAREAGKYIAYILDDDLLNIPSQVSSARYYGQRLIQGYIRGMIDLSDAIISPSPLLLDKYAKGKRAIQIKEPAIDPVEYRPHGKDVPVKIGFAGSIDRIGDIENVLRDALIRVKDAFGDRVRIEFLGAKPDFAERLGACCEPYIDSYDDYRHTLNALQWDIGLAPMPDTPFHACKHYNKFSEYAAAGVVGVFSNVQPYVRLRGFYDCAVLCENTPEAWIKALGDLINDSDRREECRRKAILCAREHFSLQKSAEELEAALPDPTRLNVTGTVKCRWLGFMKAWNVLKRVSTKVKGYGISGLMVAAITRAKGIIKHRQG